MCGTGDYNTKKAYPEPKPFHNSNFSIEFYLEPNPNPISTNPTSSNPTFTFVLDYVRPYWGALSHQQTTGLIMTLTLTLPSPNPKPNPLYTVMLAMLSS